MIKLTKKQRKVLEFIRDFSTKEGYPPSMTDIAKHFGFSQENSGLWHMRQLIKKGWMERPVPHARTLRFRYAKKPFFPGFYILKKGEEWEPVEVYEEGENLFVMRIRKFKPEIVTEDMGLWRML